MTSPEPHPSVRPYALLLRPDRAHVTAPDCEDWQFLTDRRVLWRLDALDRIDHNYLPAAGTFRFRRRKPALKLDDQARQEKVIRRAYRTWDTQVTWGSEFAPRLRCPRWSPLVYVGHRIGFVDGQPIAVDEGVYRAVQDLGLATILSAAAPLYGDTASLMAVTMHREVDGPWKPSEVVGIVPLADQGIVDSASFYLRLPLTPRPPRSA